MRKGSKHTEESKAKVSAARKGHVVTDETRAKLSTSKVGNQNAKGSKRSQESKDKISQNGIGNKNGSGNKGRKLSNRHKRKISDSSKGKHSRFPSSETKEKMSNSWKPHMKHGRSSWYEVEMPDGSIQKVQGTYELRYARYLLSQGLEFTTQPKPGLKYVDQFGGTHKYHPDFWVPSLRSYVEIKSAYTLGLRGARKKLEMVQKAGHPLIILTEVEMTEMGIDMKAKIDS